MAHDFNFRWADQQDEQSEKTFLYTNWDALLDITKQLSGDSTCIYQGNYYAGGRRIVRRIELPREGKLWIARIPTMPPELNERWWTYEQQFTMESEIATMKYIAQNTSIPVPTVFGYKIHINGNPVKLPYLLMQCIKVNILYDLGGPDALTDEQNTKLRKSIALIQCQLADAPLNKLGCLVLTANGGIDIGPLPSSFGFDGPFDSTADYFRSWASHNTKFKNLHKLPEPILRQAAESFPRRLNLTIEKLIPSDHSSNYPIVHPDFLLHNILLNDEYDIMGIIDWEYAHSAPIEVFATRTNMYASFDPERTALSWSEDERQYLADIASHEEGNKSSQKLSKITGNPLGELGLCMQLFEEGRAVRFDLVLDRIESKYLGT